MGKKFKRVDKDKPKKQHLFSVRMDDEDIKKLKKFAKEADTNFHRFVKSILYGYINYRESGGK